MSYYARRDNQLNTTSNAGNLVPAATYTVYVLEPGAVVQSAAAASNTVRVHKGHGFAASDKFLVGASASQFCEIASIDTSQTAYDTLTLTGGTTVTAAQGAVLINLGQDTGSASPNYDADAVAIYNDPAGVTALSSSSATTDSAGNYGYWCRSGVVWELIVSDGSPEDYIVDVHVSSGITETYNVKDYGAFGDGTTDDSVAIQSACDAAETAGGGWVWFPAGTYMVGSTITIRNTVSIRGTGYGSEIKAAPDFTQGLTTAIVQIEDSGVAAFHSRIEDMTIHGNARAYTGVYSVALNNSSGLRNCRVRNVLRRGVYVINSGSPSTQNALLEHIEVWADESADATFVGIDINGNAGQVASLIGCAVDVQPSGNSLPSGSIGMRLSGCHGHVLGFHAEDVDYGVWIGNASHSNTKVVQAVLSNIHGSGGTPEAGFTPTSLIYISNASNEDIVILAPRKGQFTNLIEDAHNSVTLTDDGVDFYSTEVVPFVNGMTAKSGSIDTVGDSATASFDVKCDQTSLAKFDLYAGSSLRWSIRRNAQTEAGSNAGSNLDIQAYQDNGTTNGVAVRIDRDDYRVNCYGDVSSAGYFTSSITSGITASTTQTQGQQVLTTEVNEVSTCAVASDVVTLPTAVAGRKVYIRNNGAQVLQIFPNTSDSVDGGTVDAADVNTLAAGSGRLYVAADATDWITVI